MSNFNALRYAARSAKYGYDLRNPYCPICEASRPGEPSDICPMCGETHLLTRAQAKIYLRAIKRWQNEHPLHYWRNR